MSLYQSNSHPDDLTAVNLDPKSDLGALPLSVSDKSELVASERVARPKKKKGGNGGDEGRPGLLRGFMSANYQKEKEEREKHRAALK
jgi:hypothetical protein